MEWNMVGMQRIRSKNNAAKLRHRGSRGPKAKGANPAGPTGIAAAAISIKIRELRELERQSFGPRHGKTDFYGYLKAIYKARDWTDAKASRRAIRSVAALYGIERRRNNSPIRTLIDATSNQDRQVKSRWTQALEYAVRKSVPGTGLITFLKRNGGVLGCAEKMARLRKFKPQNRIHPGRAA
jgi:hypothetical protein